MSDLEEATHAIPLGGNLFRDRWGTPDVIGKAESRRSDVIKGPTIIISAEIKVDLNEFEKGLGQANSYRLFSHKNYLVVPNHISEEELARLDTLCRMFGVGLVLFNSRNPKIPDFKLVLRAEKHEPDLFYANKYISLVEEDLFPQG